MLLVWSAGSCKSPYNRLLENYQEKDKEKEKKIKRNKHKRERFKQWKIMNYRAKHIGISLKKTEKGDIQILK